jgi:hypothetical protein
MNSTFKQEQEMIENGLAPSHEMTMEWLERCADKFKDCGQRFAESRGFKVLDEKSLARPEQPVLLPSTIDEEFAKLKAAEEN